jgi:hypothetical protein
LARKPNAHETLEFWKRRYEKAHPYEEAYLATLYRLVPVDYMEPLAILDHLATYGLRRGENRVLEPPGRRRARRRRMEAEAGPAWIDAPVWG